MRRLFYLPTDLAAFSGKYAPPQSPRLALHPQVELPTPGLGLYPRLIDKQFGNSFLIRRKVDIVAVVASAGAQIAECAVFQGEDGVHLYGIGVGGDTPEPVLVVKGPAFVVEMGAEQVVLAGLWRRGDADVARDPQPRVAGR